MITGIILLNVERSKVNEIAETLSDIEGVSEVYSVSGQYDLVAIARLRDTEQLADVVTNHMLKVEGIVRTETMLAFQVYSRHDLESMFSLGIEE